MAKYTLDVGQRGRQLTIEGLHVGDNGFRIFDFSFSERGKPFPLPDGCIATIYATLPGGVTIYETCTIDDDSALYELRGGTDEPSITAKSGKVNCEIRITDSEGNVITSPKFAFIIDKVLQDDDAIEAQESFSALTDALARTERAVDEAKNAVDEAQIAVDDARAAALSAENAVSIAGDAVRLADSVTAKATEAANNAKEAAEKSNIAVENANDAVKNANDALDRAENAETGLGSKLDKVEGTEGNLVVFGPDKTIKDGGKPSKVYTVPYYDNATDEQKAEIKAAIEAMKADSGAYNVLMILNGGEGYSIPAQALITSGTSTIIAVFRASTDTSYVVQHNIRLTAAGNVRCWSEEVATGGGGGGGGGVTEETDPTVPDWAKSPTKPTYTAEEVGALPKNTKIPTKVSELLNDEGYITSAPVTSVNGKTGAVSLSASDVKALPDTYTPPDQTAEQVGADPKGTAEAKVSAHNTSDAAHNDIRLLISGLTTRLNALADSTDTDLDQLSEIVAYIKSNKSLIDGITTNKVNVADIVNNLTTNVSNKPLSAAQGVALKALIDAITVPTKLSQLTGDSTHRVVTDAEKTAWNAKSDFSGKYADLTGKPTVPTVPSNVSAFNNDAGYVKSTELGSAVDNALTEAKESGEFDGEQGFSILRVTTAPSSYTTAVGGFTPKYRIALSTVLEQSGASEVRIGDTILRNYYTYPVGYVDSSYVYIGAYASIRGSAGTSVTITEITESTADGGSNVVAFSDGKTLTIKNGSKGGKGDKGDTPVKGVDYYTEDDKSEFSEYIASELAKRGQLAPDYANSIEECIDTSKLYVLPDGFIYAYVNTTTTGIAYTNVLDSAEINLNKRWSHSSKKFSDAAGHMATGYIPVKFGDVVRINLPLTDPNFKADYNRVHYFDANKNYVSGHTDGSPQAIFKLTAENDNVTSFVVGYECTTPSNDSTNAKLSGADDIAYMNWILRLGTATITEDDIAGIIMTINEPIEETTVVGYQWKSTGHAFVPADYEDRIVELEGTTSEHTAQIAALEKAVETGGIDETETAAFNRIKNWKYPIHEDAPVFLLEADKPAIGSDEQTTDAVYAKYDALMNANSHYITKVDCGMASDGTTPIYVYHFKEAEPHFASSVWSETKPVILICSGVHPTEQSGVHSLYYAMEEITTNPKLLDLRRNVHFIVMPMINPTGFTDSTYGVRNPDGIQVHYNFEVDFKYPTDAGYVENGNRNHGGETPLSIPETQYFDAIMNEYKDTLACVISCHNNDVDVNRGTGFVWCSCATHFMCNLGFRFIDKMSVAWREKYGTTFDEGVRWANEYALAQAEAGSSLFDPDYVYEQPEWDYRVGMASISGSGGTEYKQAIKYGIHGVNVEVCDRCMVLDKDFTKKRTANVTTMGAETYINFFRTFMAVYDPKDKKDYAPNLPWSE